MANGIGWWWRLRHAAAVRVIWPAWARPARADAASLAGAVGVGARAKVEARMTAVAAVTAASAPVGAHGGSWAAVSAMVRSTRHAGRLGLLVDRPLPVGTRLTVRFTAGTYGPPAGTGRAARFGDSGTAAECVVRRCEPGGTGRVAFAVEVVLHRVTVGE